MASSIDPDHITRILDVIATPLALELLDGLGRGATPQESVPAGTDAAALDAALAPLHAVGAIPTAQIPATEPTTLTPTGRRLLAAFRRADEIDQP